MERKEEGVRRRLDGDGILRRVGKQRGELSGGKESEWACCTVCG